MQFKHVHIKLCDLKLIIYIISGGFLLIIGFIWLGLYLKITKFSRGENDLDNPFVADRWEPRLCKFMKGNALAELKVHLFYSFYATSIHTHFSYSRITPTRDYAMI